MRGTPYYAVIPAPHSQPGHWLVGHTTPGMPGCWTVDGDALTEGGAQALARHLNDERVRAVERDCERFIDSILADQPLALAPAQ